MEENRFKVFDPILKMCEICVSVIMKHLPWRAKRYLLPILVLIGLSYSQDPGGYITESKSGHTLTIHPNRNVASLKITASEIHDFRVMIQ